MPSAYRPGAAPVPAYSLAPEQCSAGRHLRRIACFRHLGWFHCPPAAAMPSAYRPGAAPVPAYSLAPEQCSAGRHLRRIACFCFTEEVPSEKASAGGRCDASFRRYFPRPLALRVPVNADVENRLAHKIRFTEEVPSEKASAGGRCDASFRRYFPRPLALRVPVNADVENRLAHKIRIVLFDSLIQPIT